MKGIESYSQQWYTTRLGKVTSSSVWQLTVEPKEKAKKEAGELSSTAKEYVMQKVAERLTGVTRSFQNDATVHGLEQEANAIALYEMTYGYIVEETGFIEHIAGWYGGTPDGYIKQENGIVQVKCPYDYKNHLSFMLIDSVETFKAKHREYYWQCLSDMIVTNTNWCDFVSYCPDMPHEFKLFKLRIHRNNDDAALLLQKINEAKSFFDNTINKLSSIYARIS
jgi:hypothetical protein